MACRRWGSSGQAQGASAARCCLAAAALFALGLAVGRRLAPPACAQQQQVRHHSPSAAAAGQGIAGTAGAAVNLSRLAWLDAFVAPASELRKYNRSELSVETRAKIEAAQRRLDELLGPAGVACRPRPFGRGWGAHHLCTHAQPRPPCFFYSFGISVDYSFDTALADAWGCRGFAADPSVVLPSALHPRVSFHNVAANGGLDASAPANASVDAWLRTSVPGLRRWLGHERIAVLKLDCEGCEYALARDVATEEPGFFRRVDQLALEVHLSRMWLRGPQQLAGLAALLQLLDDAGLSLAHVRASRCGAFALRTGLLPELRAVMPSLTKRHHCLNLLFARGLV